MQPPAADAASTGSGTEPPEPTASESAFWETSLKPMSLTTSPCAVE